MKSINKILIIFLFFSLVAVSLTWKLIHSERFSKEISDRASVILTKKMGAQLSFKSVEFGLFPPSTKFIDVVMNKPLQFRISADVNIKELGIYFTFASLISTELEIDEVELKSGRVSVFVEEDPTTPDIDWKNLHIPDLFKKYQTLYEQMPIHLNTIRLSNIETKINDVQFNSKSLVLSPHKKEVRLKVNIEKLRIPQMEFPAVAVQGKIKIDKENINLNEARISNDLNYIGLNAEVSSPHQKLEMITSGDFRLNFLDLGKYIKQLPSELSTVTGLSSGTFETAGRLFDPDIQLNIEIKKLSTDWVQLASVKASIQKLKHLISLKSFVAQNNNEVYTVGKTGALFDLNRKVFLNSKTRAVLKNAETNTFLYTIRDSLEVFKGNITGEIFVVWDGLNLSFEINNPVNLKDFALKSQGSEKNILINKGFIIEKGKVSLEKNLTVVGIDLNLSTSGTKINAAGKIYKDKIDIEIKNSTINLLAFGPIAGVRLDGAGPTSLKIHGPMDDVVFDLDVFWKNFSVVDLNLGDINSTFSLSLKNLELVIPKLTGVFNQSKFIANGKMQFSDHSNMDLNFNFQETTFKDAQKMYHLVFRNMKNIPDTDLKFETAYTVKGGFDLKDLEVKGKIKGRELKIFEEEADFANLDFELKNEKLIFDKIKISKSRGEVQGKLSLDLQTNHMDLVGDGKGLKLSDFNLYRNAGLDYDGELLINFNGSGTSEKFPSVLNIQTSEAFIDNIMASPSKATVLFANNEINMNLDVLAGKIKADIKINMDSKDISIQSIVDTPEIKELLGVLSSHNLLDKSLSGRIKGKFQADFNLITKKVRKIFAEISSFNLKKSDVDIRNVSGKNIASIENGSVKKWDMRFVDGIDYFNSVGENITPEHVTLRQDFSIKSSIFQLFSRYVDKANGKLKGGFSIDLADTTVVHGLNIIGKDNSIKFKNMPGIITELDFDVAKEKDLFLIKRIVGKYGEGEFRLTGNALFDKLLPQINIEYKVERSTVPLFKRSSVLVSGNGALVGVKPPYKLTGKFQVLHGEFLDDPSEYSSDKKISLEEYKKFMPDNDHESVRSYLDYNIFFETQATPVLVKNNMSEIYLKGSGTLTGTPVSPEINARIEATPMMSKFKFKGHEFIINQGFVDLKDTGKNKTSDVKFVGISKINDYEMKLDVTGKIDKLNINLSSEPALAQEDLLSLLTLGVTSDMSKNMEAGERKFVQTVGIGTLLVDQLKINEDLNSSLGLKLSVMPEFKEDVTSLVQGKSAVSDSAASSRLKSSTKIKVNKKITKQVDVSLSSTVGGSIEQKQEVNVNFNFNKNLSLEGVYEVKPSEDTSTSTSTPNSVGADLKYRWSF